MSGSCVVTSEFGRSVMAGLSAQEGGVRLRVEESE